MLRKGILFFVFLALIAGAISCSVWRQLGKMPNEKELSVFVSSEHFNQDMQIFENRRPELIEAMSKRIDMGTMIDFFLNDTPHRVPEEPLPEMKPVDIQKFLEPTDSVRFVWLGHSSIMMNVQNRILLFDPIFSNAAAPINFMVERFQPPVIRLEELPEIDWILISHDHYDHLDMETVEFFKDKGARFAVPLGVGAHLRYWGIPEDRIFEMDWWQKKSVDGIDFHCTPSQHFSGRTGEDMKTLWASWSVEAEGVKIFFSGDSGYDIHYRQIGERLGPFDLVFMDSGQYNLKWREVHNLPEEAVKGAKELRADYLVPIHWGMFELALHEWYEPVVRSYQSAKSEGVNLLTPMIGQVVELEQPNAFARWWEDLIE